MLSPIKMGGDDSLLLNGVVLDPSIRLGEHGSLEKSLAFCRRIRFSDLRYDKQGALYHLLNVPNEIGFDLLG